MKSTINAILLLPILLTLACSQDRYPGPLPPDKALESFQLREDFKIELFAAEPHVMDPVEMVFDEKGNVYVAEMRDYPFMPEQGKGAGRIRILHDTDNDGLIDGSTLFADSILEVTSMLPWKGGLIVTAAPHILYLQDTDGDLRADKTEVLFSGFFENNSEAQITSLRFGVDNWIYAANNGQNGSVTFSRKPDAPPLSMSGADFRFRLDRGQFERESGAAQFGHTLDDWNHRFITQNTLHIRQVVIPGRYLYRHEHMPATSVLLNISDHELEMFQLTPPPYWRAERTRRRQQQYKEQNLDRIEYAEDHFTGSSGGTMYDGDAFAEEYYGNVFTGDVAGNLVHRDVLAPSDDTPVFVARRDEGERTKEFLASTDSWFRPASFAVGPDGFLYVIDMYRQHIETPLSIPEDLKADMDFLNGSDRGRIYRIVPQDVKEENSSSDFKALAAGEYVRLLTHPNRWWRLQAQRLLLERQDHSAVPAVKNLFEHHTDPRVRLHALYVLEGLDKLDAIEVAKALADPHPGVREHGLILSEQYPQLFSKVVDRIADSSVQVAFQAVLSAGQFSDKRAVQALAKAVQQYGEDPWFRTAVLSSEAGSSSSLLTELNREHDFFAEARPWKTKFLEEISYSIGAANRREEIVSFLNTLSSPHLEKDSQWQMAGISGLKKGLQKSTSIDASQKAALETIQTSNASEIKEAIKEFKKMYGKRSAA